MVQVLLHYDAIDQIHSPNADGNKPIHLAAQINFNMLKTIVEAGGDGDVNERNKIGRTALHEVAEKGDEQMLKLMYRLKADANIMDKVSDLKSFRNLNNSRLSYKFLHVCWILNSWYTNIQNASNLEFEASVRNSNAKISSVQLKPTFRN